MAAKEKAMEYSRACCHSQRRPPGETTEWLSEVPHRQTRVQDDGGDSKDFGRYDDYSWEGDVRYKYLLQRGSDRDRTGNTHLDDFF